MTSKDDALKVSELIEFLENNFKNEDKLCFFDEGGAWVELVRIPDSLIGDWMFRYAKDKKKEELERLHCKKEDEDYMKKVIEEEYRFVDGDEMVIY